MKKRILAIILCVTMMMSSMMCMTVNAQESTDVSLSDLTEAVSEGDKEEEIVSPADAEQADDDAAVLEQEEEKAAQEENEAVSEMTAESSADIEEAKEEAPAESKTDLPKPQVQEFAPNAFGYVPDYRILSSTQTDDGRIKGTLPSSYSSVTGGYVTPVKNQNPFGCCWAFSSVNCIESSLLVKNKKTIPDFSELHLAYFTFNRPVDPLGLTAGDSFTVSEGNGLNVGGNYRMAAYTLAAGVGPVPDKVLSYDLADDNAIYDSELAYINRTATINNVIEISAGNSDGIKDAVMKYGSVGTSYYHDNYYISAKGAYYNYDYDIPNHAVSIVGWDDNYPKENFNSSKLPENNGAWLIKNSWDTWFANDGYCWLSYEDLSFMPDISGKYESCFAFDFTNGADEDEYNYQYDGGYINNSITSSGNKGGLANVYTAKRSEQISSVGVVTENENLSYSLQIYKNPTSVDDPTSGTAMLTAPAEGKFFEAGYHTITLSTQPKFKKDDKFAAVITLTCDSGKTIDMVYDCSANWGWCESVSANNSGESYILYGGNWYDLHQFGGAARIKVHTVPAPKETYTVSFDSNGGSNKYEPKTKTEGTDINLYSQVPERDGYMFQNWNTKKDGTGDAYQPGGVYSVDADVTFYAQWKPDGTCGENMTWTLDENGNLILSGKGGMYLWTEASEYPWHSESAKIKRVIVANTITEIGENAFADCSSITMYGYSGTCAETYAAKNSIPFIDLTPSLKASPAEPTEIGEQVTLTATGGITYKFYYECAGSWVRIQDFSTKNTCTWTPAKAGTYKFYCDIMDAENNLVTCEKLTFNITEKYALSADKSANQTTGTAIKFTAAGGASYKFYYERSGSWVRIQDFSSNNTCTWTPKTAGSYVVYVDIKDASGTLVSCKTLKFTISDAFSLTADKTSPLNVNSTVTLTAAGGASYKFYTECAGSWVRVQDFSSNNTCTWTPKTAGSYVVYVDIKDASGALVSCKTLKFTVADTFSLTADKTSPVNVNSTVTLTAAGGASYKFYTECAGSWVRVQDFSSKNTCTWTPKTAGSYVVYVDIKDASGALVSCKTLKFTVADTFSLTADKTSPLNVNSTVTLTATGGASYKFYTECAGSWVRVQDFSSKNTCTWTPKTAGSYVVYVDIKDASGTLVSCKTLKFTVADTFSLTADKTSPLNVNSNVTLTAAGGASYKFYTECAGSWVRIQDFSSNNTCTWTPKTAGSYVVYVDIKDASGALVSCKTLKFTVADTFSLTADKTSPVNVNSTVTFTAAGGASYKFYTECAGSWVRIQDFSSKNTCTWTPKTAGSYVVYVDIQDASGALVSCKTMKFVIE